MRLIWSKLYERIAVEIRLQIKLSAFRKVHFPSTSLAVLQVGKPRGAQSYHFAVSKAGMASPPFR